MIETQTTSTAELKVQVPVHVAVHLVPMGGGRGDKQIYEMKIFADGPDAVEAAQRVRDFVAKIVLAAEWGAA